MSADAQGRHQTMWTTVLASELSNPSDDVSTAAMACSMRVIEILEAGNDVLVSFEGFRGASSSYFNTLWLSLFDRVGAAALTRVRMETKSRVLTDIIHRCRDAALKRYPELQRAAG